MKIYQVSYWDTWNGSEKTINKHFTKKVDADKYLKKKKTNERYDTLDTVNILTCKSTRQGFVAFCNAYLND